MPRALVHRSWPQTLVLAAFSCSQHGPGLLSVLRATLLLATPHLSRTPQVAHLLRMLCRTPTVSFVSTTAPANRNLVRHAMLIAAV